MTHRFDKLKEGDRFYSAALPNGNVFVKDRDRSVTPFCSRCNEYHAWNAANAASGTRVHFCPDTPIVLALETAK